MFTKLWKRSPTDVSDAGFQFTVVRQRGEPIRFNGVLQVESVGATLPGYRPGDPWHTLRVYQLENGGHAVVIEFHVSAQEIAVDAGIVASAAEVDDFFCMHAGENFHRMALDESSDDLDDVIHSARRDKQLEQRVLTCYDRQLLDVLNHLPKSDFGVKDG